MSTRDHLRSGVLVAALCLAAGCSRDPVHTRPRPAAPRAESAEPAVSAEAGAGFIGVVMASATVDLTSQIEGRIERLHVRPGDAVRVGDVLAELDTTAAHKTLAIANAELLAANADLRRAELEGREAKERLARRSRTIALPGGDRVGTVSQEELSSARYQVELGAVKIETARAAVLEKRARCDELRTAMAEGTVRAPFDGTISKRFVDEGAILRRGDPIVRVIAAGDLKVRFAVPEAAALRVDLGATVRVTTDGLELTGQVEKVAPEVDAAARMVFAEAELTVPESARTRVRSGAVARVFLDALPRQALR